MLPEWASWLAEEVEDSATGEIMIEEKSYVDALIDIVNQMVTETMDSLVQAVKDDMIGMDQKTARECGFDIIEDSMTEPDLWQEFMFQVNDQEKWNFDCFKDAIESYYYNKLKSEISLWQIRILWLQLEIGDPYYDDLQNIPTTDKLIEDIAQELFGRLCDLAEMEYIPCSMDEGDDVSEEDTLDEVKDE